VCFGTLIPRYFVVRTYQGVGQFDNRRGYRRHAQIGARITCNVLLRLQGGPKEESPWATHICAILDGTVDDLERLSCGGPSSVLCGLVEPSSLRNRLNDLSS